MVVTNGQQWSLAVTPNRWLTWGIPGFLGFFRTSRVPSHGRSRQFDPAIAHSRFPLVRSDSSTTRLRELGSNDRAHPCPTSADECNLGSGREIQRPDAPDRVALNVKSPLRHVGLQSGCESAVSLHARLRSNSTISSPTSSPRAARTRRAPSSRSSGRMKSSGARVHGQEPTPDQDCGAPVPFEEALGRR
jgi:hypothetical protein